MLPEIAAEALLFLARRDLDKASSVSKWLDTLIAQCCGVYPLRPVTMVQLYRDDSKFNVGVEIDDDLSTESSFGTLDEAFQFAGAILRHSYTEHLQVGPYLSHGISLTLSPNHWMTLMDAIRSGAVRRFHSHGVDLSALDDGAFLVAVGFRGLRSFRVQWSVIRVGFVTDNLIRSSIAKGLITLHLCGNKSDAPYRLSEDGVLDFFFRDDEAKEGQSLSLVLEADWVTDKFLKKFFERLRSSHARPSGILEFHGGTPKQRGLSAFARYLAPNEVNGVDATYRVPSLVDDDASFEVKLREGSDFFNIQCQALQQ